MYELNYGVSIIQILESTYEDKILLDIYVEYNEMNF